MYRGLHLIPHDTRIDFMRYHKVTFAFSMINGRRLDPADRVQGLNSASISRAAS